MTTLCYTYAADTQDAPRTLLLDSSSSMESLCSSGSATSTSNFSKGSSPPGSPTGGRRRFFNPAEVDKLPSAGKVNASQVVRSLLYNVLGIIAAKYSFPSTVLYPDTECSLHSIKFE